MGLERAWVPAGVALAFAVALPGALAEGGEIRVRGAIQTPAASSPMSLQVQVIPVAPDEDGRYRVVGQTQVLRVDCDPSGSSGGEFAMVLEVNREYELRVDLIGEDGFPRPDGTYYFAGLTDQNQERSTQVASGADVPIPLRFQWRPRAQSRGNFLLPRRSAQGGFEVTQYIAFANAVL